MKTKDENPATHPGCHPARRGERSPGACSPTCGPRTCPSWRRLEPRSAAHTCKAKRWAPPCRLGLPGEGGGAAGGRGGCRAAGLAGWRWVMSLLPWGRLCYCLPLSRRTEESLNRLSWRRPLKAIWSNSPAASRDTRSSIRVLRAAPASPWVSPGMGHPPPLWAAADSASPPSE